MRTTPKERVKVWDPLLRVGHWTLATVFTTAYLTGHAGTEHSDLHELAGYTAGGILMWRIVWGINGPRTARFKTFVRSPVAALNYAFKLIRGKAPRYIGHEPAGAAMIVAILACLSLTVSTGVITNRGRAPVAQTAATAVAPEPSNKTPARTAAGTAAGASNIVGEVHGVLARMTLALVLIHILGVLYASLVHRENLAGSMVTGRKRLEDV